LNWRNKATNKYQASIDYVRYLEDCVTSLKAQNNRSGRTPTPEDAHNVMPPPPAAREPYNYEDEDEDMEGSDAETSPTYAPTAYSHHPSVSPAIPPQDNGRHNSYSSASYSYSTSTNTSPNFGPQSYEYAISNTSALTSPALAPQRGSDRDLDHEATAALLMLNTDRRNTGSGGARGMSVKDLLSA
jgi:hypothetical protein